MKSVLSSEQELLSQCEGSRMGRCSITVVYDGAPDLPSQSQQPPEGQTELGSAPMSRDQPLGLDPHVAVVLWWTRYLTNPDMRVVCRGRPRPGGSPGRYLLPHLCHRVPPPLLQTLTHTANRKHKWAFHNKAQFDRPSLETEERK